jgi:hypothetical protein
MKFLYTLCALVLFGTQANLLAISQSDWQKAKTEMIANAKKSVTTYKKNCPISVQMFEILVSTEKEVEIWNLALEIITSVEAMPLYKLATSHPHDDLYWQELLLQTSLAIEQIAAKDEKNRESMMKIGLTIGSYINHLKEKIRKK